MVSSMSASSSTTRMFDMESSDRAGERQPELEGGARAGGAGDADPPRVAPRHAGDDGEPQPGAAAERLAVPSLVEALEDVLTLLLRDAWAGVAHRDAGLALRAAKAERHRPGGRRELERVVQQVGDRAEHQGAVDLRDDRLPRLLHDERD